MDELIARALMGQALLELIQEVVKLTECVIEIEKRLTKLEEKVDGALNWPPYEC